MARGKAFRISKGPGGLMGAASSIRAQSSGARNQDVYSFMEEHQATKGGKGGASSWTPDASDADIWAWWSGGQHIIATPTFDVSVWGDNHSRTVDKTIVTNTRNLSNYTGSFPGLATPDNKENFIPQSNTISTTLWAAVGVTKDTATTFTFTLTNGQITTPVGRLTPGHQYKVMFKLRQITGNTSLQILHLSASSPGDTTNITINSVLALYTVTFTASNTAGTIHYVGVRDPNVSGFGQVEMTDMQVVDITSDVTFQASTTGHPVLRKRNVQHVFNAYLRVPFTHQMSVNDTLNQPCTYYLSMFTYVNGGFVFASISPTWNMALLWDPPIIGGVLTAYSNATGTRISLPTGKVPLLTWSVITLVFNGTSSSIRFNKETPVTGSHAASSPVDRGFYVGGDVFSGSHADVAFYDFIIRSVADDIATQDTYIDYMANRVGLIA